MIAPHCLLLGRRQAHEAGRRSLALSILRRDVSQFKLQGANKFDDFNLQTSLHVSLACFGNNNSSPDTGASVFSFGLRAWLRWSSRPARALRARATFLMLRRRGRCACVAIGCSPSELGGGRLRARANSLALPAARAKRDTKSEEFQIFIAKLVFCLFGWRLVS